MSRFHKPKQWKPFQQGPAGTALKAEIPDSERTRVEQLLAAGKTGLAVDIAKQAHKRYGTSASESLLVDAYSARISELASRGLDADAKTLMESVRDRYPSARARLLEAVSTLAARNGDLAALVEPLRDPSLAPERRAVIEEKVLANVGDLQALARCEALESGHPLRAGAEALLRALYAVTTGPVDEAVLALPEISRRSPLSPWKILLRAIAAFYRRDDASARSHLDAIDARSAAAHAGAALRNLLDGRMPSAPAARALADKVGGGLEALRLTLGALDEALDKKRDVQAIESIRSAVAIAARDYPELLVPLRQHISIRAMMANIKPARVAAAMGGPSLRSANFWRLLARASEEQAHHDPTALLMACAFWEEFRRHAIHEKWVPAEGPEVAALYLHIADLLHRLDVEDLGRLQNMVGRRGSFNLSHEYEDQPPEIRALMITGPRDMYFIDPGALLERACAADPCAPNFRRWLKWTTEHDTDSSDRAAGQWRAALPRDIEPLLHLMESAEKRNALRKAFQAMEEAERLDPLNPEVRRARMRLLVSMLVRHFQQKKPHLAETDIRQLTALPLLQQGDRPAFLEAARWFFCVLRGAHPEVIEIQRREVVRIFQDETAAFLLLEALARACKFKLNLPEPGFKGASVAAAGRVCALAADMNLPLRIPRKLSDQLRRGLPAGALDGPALEALGEAALNSNDAPLAYEVAAAGFGANAALEARALFLRARALPDWEDERREQCAGAASELARRQRDLGLLEKIGAWREEELDSFISRDAAALSMTTAQIEVVVAKEKAERAYPKPERGNVGECNCPACRAERRRLGAMGSVDDLEETSELFGKMLDEFGPDVVMKALGEMLGAGAKPKRRGRSRRYDDPF